MHCDEMWAYWNGTLKKNGGQSGILLRMWDILTSKKGTVTGFWGTVMEQGPTIMGQCYSFMGQWGTEMVQWGKVMIRNHCKKTEVPNEG